MVFVNIKLIVLVAVLTIVHSLASVTFACLHQKSLSLPSIPKLLFLSCWVELALLTVYELVARGSQNTTRRRSGQDDSWVPLPDEEQFGSAVVAQKANRHSEQQTTHSTSSCRSRAGNASSSWALLLIASLLSTAAGNIYLKLLRQLQPYAWSQLGLLEVVVMGLLLGIGRTTSSSARTTSFQGRRAYLVLLLFAVCLGQGLVGWSPGSPIAVMNEEDESLVQSRHTAVTAASASTPTMAIWLAALAVFCSSLAAQILQHRPHPQGKHGVQLAVQMRHCALVLACNLLLYLCTKAEPVGGLFDDMTPTHWHGVLLLAMSSLLSSQLSRWPAGVQLLSKGYAYQCTAVITAACSSWLLQTQAPHDVWQATQFACSSLVAGAALLLLHSSMQQPTGSKARSVQQSCKAGVAWLRQHALVKRLQLCWMKDALLCVWAVTALQWLLVAGWSAHSSGCNPRLAFTYAPSKLAMAELGITKEVLSMRSTAPFPGSVLLASQGWAAWLAINTAATRAAANSEVPSMAAVGTSATSVPAWSLCPALVCSTDATCSPSNSTCCAHLLQHMLAFWDAFMHGLGLHEHYVMLHDTLMDAAYKGALRADAQVAQTGVSAAALTVLERPCVKEALWQHGYVLFLQGSSWRLCAHRDHPLPAFRRLMHPVRHMTAATAATYVDLDVMWPLHQRQQQDGQHMGPASGAAASTLLSRMQEAVARSVAPQQAPGQLSWWLCSTGKVLTTAQGYRVSTRGLHLPRPIHAMQHMTNRSPSTSEAGSVQTRVGRNAARCQRLITELLYIWSSELAFVNH